MGLFGGGGGASVDLASPPAIGNTTPNTGAFTTLSFAPANNTTGFSNTGNSLTGSNAQSLVSLAQTWNTTGNPTAFLLNVTATAAGSTSKLLDLQVGGTTVFYVPRTINEDQGVLVNNTLMIGAAYGNGWIKTTSSAAINIGGAANTANLFVNGGIRLGNGSTWGNNGTLSFAPANNTTGFSNTGNSLTGSNAQSLVSLAQTWNTTGNPTAILLNVTATAAGSTSKLLDLQVGGTTVFYIPRTISEDSGVLIGNTLRIGAAYGGGWIKTTAASAINIGGAANTPNLFVNGGIRIGNGSEWGNNGTLFFLHEADNTLAIRNGTNGQTARLYNTFTRQ